MMKDPINKVIMEEIGLTVDSSNRVMDQDTRALLSYKDKNMKYSSQNSVTLTNKDIVFDPASNKAIMGSLFDHFLTKIEDEEGTYVSLHYEKKNEKDNSTALVAIVDGEEITTDYYNNDSLKYVEMMRHLNESIDTDLHNMDSEAKPIEDNLNCRKGAGTEYDVERQIDKDVAITIVAEVKAKDGGIWLKAKSGYYVNKKYMKFVKYV